MENGEAAGPRRGLCNPLPADAFPTRLGTPRDPLRREQHPGHLGRYNVGAEEERRRRVLVQERRGEAVVRERGGAGPERAREVDGGAARGLRGTHIFNPTSICA